MKVYLKRLLDGLIWSNAYTVKSLQRTLAVCTTDLEIILTAYGCLNDPAVQVLKFVALGITTRDAALSYAPIIPSEEDFRDMYCNLISLGWVDRETGYIYPELQEFVESRCVGMFWTTLRQRIAH